MRRILLISVVFVSTLTFAQQTLRKSLEDVIINAKAKVALSADYLPLGKSKTEHIGINEFDTMTTMSVIKFPIAISVLHSIESGELNKNSIVYADSIMISKNTYSPLRDKYNKPFSANLLEALSYSVSQSDNIATDMVIDAMKGTKRVMEFLTKRGYNCMQLGTYYRDMTYEKINLNWSTSSCMNKLLLDFYRGKLLTPENNIWLYNQMLNTPTTSKRIKGKLAEHIAVAHKTGTYFKDDSIPYAEAVNDIGIITLPNGDTIVLTIFVNKAEMLPPDVEDLIASLTKIIFDFYNK